jgi:hypothetical protein
VRFYVGVHQPSDAKRFDRVFISVNRMKPRKAPLKVGEWIMDSGAFTELAAHGRYREGVASYAREIDRCVELGGLVAAVSQDFMCEPWIIQKTGLSLDKHQRLTVERYDALLDVRPKVYVMPVLQGYAPDDYLRSLDLYGLRLGAGAWVGVGSICKRNADVAQVASILTALKNERPDLRLHGFGLKTTALLSRTISSLLESADSLSWSYAARRQGRNQNDWREAQAFIDKIERGVA